jgi:hypothetical protein
MDEKLIAKARELRAILEKAMTIASGLTDAEAVTATCLHPRWNASGVAYAKGQRVQYDGVLYTVLQAHTSQATWTPTAAPSLFAKVLIPDPTVVPEWEQPDSTNPYMKGDKVKHNGKTWVSLVDNNVWEPGVTGTAALWQEVTA